MGLRIQTWLDWAVLAEGLITMRPESVLAWQHPSEGSFGLDLQDCSITPSSSPRWLAVEAGLFFFFAPVWLSGMVGCQGSWTSYMPAGFLHNEWPKRTGQKPLGFYDLTLEVMRKKLYWILLLTRESLRESSSDLREETHGTQWEMCQWICKLNLKLPCKMSAWPSVKHWCNSTGLGLPCSPHFHGFFLLSWEMYTILDAPTLPDLVPICFLFSSPKPCLLLWTEGLCPPKTPMLEPSSPVWGYLEVEPLGGDWI